MLAWRETLERNWPYMVTATLLSVLLWVAVSAETVSQATIATDLVIINNDRDYVLTAREPESDVVSVVFAGDAGDLVSLQVQRPQIFVSIDSVTSLVQEIELTADMVKGRGGRELVDVRPAGIKPDVIRLQFQPRAQRVVPVIPTLDINLADGYMLADSVRVDPSAVAVDGPEDAVAQIDSVFTVPVVRERLRESIEAEAPLALPEASSLVTFSVPSARVTVAVDARAERVFPGLPLRVRGLDATEYRVEPSLVDVTLIGPRTALTTVRPEALLPWIELSGEADLGRMLPVYLDSPAAFVEFVIEPDSARVVRTVELAQ